MGLSHLILLLAISCASLAWVPRDFDQDRSKTRRFGVLENWGPEDPGIMMNPEMRSRPNKLMEEHQVPLFYDDDFAEPEGPYPKREQKVYKKLSYSVIGSKVPIRPRPNYYNLYRRGNQPVDTSTVSTKPRLNAQQLKDRYAWPRAMDRANNRENLEHMEKGIIIPRREKPPAHPNDF